MNMKNTKWQKGSISDIALINPKKNIGSLSKNENITFIPMEAVSENGKLTVKYTKKLIEVQNGYTQFNEGDILFAKITPCMENGKGCKATDLVNHTGFGSTEFHVLRAIQNNNPDFIYHHTQSIHLRQKAKSSMTGSAGQQRVPSDFFSKYKIEIPPLPEQKKIAEVLTTIDNVIEKTQQLIEKLKSIKKGLMQDLFTRGVTPDGKLRPAHKDAPELYKESELGWIPKEWECLQIKDIVSEKPEYGIGASALDYNDQLPRYLRITDINDEGELLFDDIKSVYIGSQWGYILKKDDIVIARTGNTVGKSYIFNEKDGLMAFAGYLIRFRISQSKAIPLFLFFHLQSPRFLQWINKTLRIGAQPNINSQEYLSHQLRVPSLDEQLKIIVIIDSINQKILNEKRLKIKYAKIKKGLMDDLLTGRVRVNELIEEVI